MKERKKSLIKSWKYFLGLEEEQIAFFQINVRTLISSTLFTFAFALREKANPLDKKIVIIRQINFERKEVLLSKIITSKKVIEKVTKQRKRPEISFVIKKRLET